MNNVQVHVIGPTGTGTSTIAQIVAEALLKAGFSRTSLAELDHSPRPPDQIIEIVNRIGENTNVTVFPLRMPRRGVST